MESHYFTGLFNFDFGLCIFSYLRFWRKSISNHREGSPNGENYIKIFYIYFFILFFFFKNATKNIDFLTLSEIELQAEFVEAKKNWEAEKSNYENKIENIQKDYEKKSTAAERDFEKQV